MDEIERRREARRRKILENSQNRLEKISGIENKSIRLPTVPVNDEAVGDRVVEANGEIPQISECIVTQEPQVNNRHEFSSKVKESDVKVVDKKHIRTVMVICLAIFVNYFFILLEKIFSINSENSLLNVIFVPLFAYELIIYSSQTLNLQNDNNNKMMFYLQILLKSYFRQQRHFIFVIRMFQIISEISRDVMIYFFFFSCGNFIKSQIFPAA